MLQNLGRTLHGRPARSVGPFVALLLVMAACSRLYPPQPQPRPMDHDAAVQELKRRGIESSPTAFVAAAEKGDLELVNVFLSAGMDPNARDVSERTALMAAAHSRQVPLCQLLLDRGAGVDQADKDGLTALHHAASLYCAQCVQLLLKHGAPINTKDARGDTPLMLAVPDMPLSDSKLLFLRSDSERAVSTLLDQGADINEKNNVGATPLMRAAVGGNMPIIELLLKRGADVKAVNSRGQTARMFAVEYRHDDAVAIISHAGG